MAFKLWTYIKINRRNALRSMNVPVPRATFSRIPRRSFPAVPPFLNKALRSQQPTTMTPPAATTPLKVLLLGVHINPGEPFEEGALVKLIEGDIAGGLQHGLDIQYRLTHAADPEYEPIVAKLRSQPWDVIAVGAGVRFPRDRAALFEWMVNAAMRFVKPIPILVFNTSPDGIVRACLRVKPEIERIERLQTER